MPLFQIKNPANVDGIFLLFVVWLNQLEHSGTTETSRESARTGESARTHLA